jgi:hypothetical protein
MSDEVPASGLIFRKNQNWKKMRIKNNLLHLGLASPVGGLMVTKEATLPWPPK